MRKLLPVLVLISFAASCAQVLMPGGGPKDTTPPKVADYEPDSAATNFKGNKIIIRFNEYVTLSDLNNQLVISPPVNTTPDVTIRKKEVVVEFHDTLQDNTTYTISFGNAIRDITEGNVLENFRYVFSTGSVIDSLEISGKVVNASTLGPEKGIFVMLYRATDDSVPLKQKPYYFAKTKPDGTFRMTNLQAGTYKAFALDDKNSNYLYDNSEERIAFADNLITLSNDYDSLNLRLFKEEPSKMKRGKVTQLAKGRYVIYYSKPFAHPHVSIPGLPPNAELFQEVNPTGDSINIWISNFAPDSFAFQVEDQRAIVDSIPVVYQKPTKSGRGGGAPKEALKLQLTTNAAPGALFDLGKALIIASNNPLKNFNANDFILLKGKDTLRSTVTLSENKRALTFDYQFEEDSSYSFFIRPGAATDIFGQKSDTLKGSFKIQSSRYYGTLNVKLQGLPAGNYLLYLVTEKDAVVRQMKLSDFTQAKFDMLPPGQYRLKLVNDANGNGKWDTGNYLQHRQPERVIYYISPLKMRAGWDMDIEWKF